jgi:hypothetical protein
LDDAAVTRIAAKRASSTRAAMKILDRIPRKPEPPASRSPAATDFERELWENLRKDDNTKR